MRIVPAVDIRGGLCVNLVQGDYAQETVFSIDPVAQAVLWRDQGAAIVHIVDLDGAKAGHVCIADTLRAMSDAGIRTEVGGGIRTMHDLDIVFGAGVERAIIGTAAHENPAFLHDAVAAYPERIAVGIDARAGKVSLNAWLEDTGTGAVEFAQQVERIGASRIIYTDILRDGMMKGPNVDGTRDVARAVGIPVTVSGGMSTLDDVRHVCAAEPDGVDEVIVGRALYLGAFTLPEAIAATRGEP